MKAVITPITRSRQKADFEKDRDNIKELVYKLRLFSGVAQNVINNAVYDLAKQHKRLIKQELKLSVKAVRKQLQRISEREHEITKDENADWYFDEKADELYRQAKKEAFMTYNIVHKHFSDHGTDIPSFPAIMVSAVLCHSLVMDCMGKVIDATPITERFKPIIKEQMITEHKALSRLATNAANLTIKRTKFNTRPKPIFINNSFNIGEKYHKPLETAMEQFGLKITNLKDWEELVDEEDIEN